MDTHRACVRELLLTVHTVAAHWSDTRGSSSPDSYHKPASCLSVDSLDVILGSDQKGETVFSALPLVNHCTCLAKKMITVFGSTLPLMLLVHLDNILQVF